MNFKLKVKPGEANKKNSSREDLGSRKALPDTYTKLYKPYNTYALPHPFKLVTYMYIYTLPYRQYMYTCRDCDLLESNRTPSITCPTPCLPSRQLALSWVISCSTFITYYISMRRLL